MVFGTRSRRIGWLLLVLGVSMRAAAAADQPSTTIWTPSGWGGGGFYWAAVFHPTRDGVLYLSGDVNGVYKSEDHGRSWATINNGLAAYGVFSLAVDRKNPETVYAATEGGLCKSADGGAHWKLLPGTDGKHLHITGEKEKSIRCIAVDPNDGGIVYAGSPAGIVFKSIDGGGTWAVSYEKKGEADSANALTVRFGKVNGDAFGGFWMPLTFPGNVKPEECTGFGFSFKSAGAQPRDAFLTLTTAGGILYRSRNLTDIFKGRQWSDVKLQEADFIVDPEYAAKHPEDAKSQPTPLWSTVNRLDFVCVGALAQEESIGRFGKFFFSYPSPAANHAPMKATAREFSTDKTVRTYGNVAVNTAAEGGGTVYSVAVAPSRSSLVIAATSDAGLLISDDAGATWRSAKAPMKASSAAVAAGDPNIIYASFFTDGIWKSTDSGLSWKQISQGLPKQLSVREVAVSPANHQDVYAIGSAGWGGAFYFSHDGGQTWKDSSTLAADAQGDPTLPGDPRNAPLSAPSNLAINPRNPQELFISANWRCCMSEDGGRTWTEHNRGADISCIYDIRFSGTRTYVSAMDEGTFASDNDGKEWKQLWPLKWTQEISGHNWRLAVTSMNGADRVIATCSPWDGRHHNRVIVSSDGGKTYQAVTAGLPDYSPTADTMWGQGYARALAVDPKNPRVLYLGIDGDPDPGKNGGGGVFRSEDGGNSWKQLAHQPGSRRMFFGLAVDPTDSKRLFWATCGDRGGLYRSEDSGDSWKLVFKGDEWLFNVLVTADGTVYCPGKNLFRSTDHGNTWKQLTQLSDGRAIVGLEVHPGDPRTIWFSTTTWDSSPEGAVYKTTNGGATWQDITGNLPYRKPMILRFNPATSELWAGGVGLYRVKQ